MKTIAKILVAISILMISNQAFSAGNITPAGSVHYKVNIHLPKVGHIDPKDVFVVITDGKGLVAQPQPFRIDKLSYDFSEVGTKVGTRTAALVYSDGTSIGWLNCTPDTKSGRFLAGNTYEFNLYILLTETGKNTE